MSEGLAVAALVPGGPSAGRMVAPGRVRSEVSAAAASGLLTPPLSPIAIGLAAVFGILLVVPIGG